MAEKEKLPFLGSLPLDPSFTDRCDKGNILVELDSPVAGAIRKAAQKLDTNLKGAVK